MIQYPHTDDVEDDSVFNTDVAEDDPEDDSVFTYYGCIR